MNSFDPSASGSYHEEAFPDVDACGFFPLPFAINFPR